MRKQALFIALAVGLLANLAFVTSSQAGSTTIYVNSELASVPTNAAIITGVDVTFTGITSISNLKVTFPSGSTASVVGSTVDITIPAKASAAFVNLDQALVTFNFSVPGNGLGLGIASTNWVIDGKSVSGQSTLLLDPPGVPEPASMSLLGIGMAGLVAFRRYFRRNTTVQS